MIKTIVEWIYRGIYCAFLGLVFVSLLLRLPIGESLRPFEIPLFYAFLASLALALFSAVAFSHVPEWLSWVAALLVCVLFVWYGWFSLGAPFVLHELHTFDPVEAAKESRAYRNSSLIGTAIMIGFLMFLPVFRHFSRRQKLHSE
jgi:hypothetical protein